MNKYAENVRKGAVFVLVLSLLSAAVGFGFRIFLSRSLSVEDFGLFYSVLAFAALIGLFKDLGLPTSLVKYVAEFRAKNDFRGIKSAVITVYVAQLVVGLLVFVPFIFFSDYLAANYFGSAAASIVLTIILIEGIINMGIYLSVFQGMRDFRIFGMIELFRVSILFGLSLILADRGIVGIALAQLFTTIVMNGIFISIMIRRMKFFISEKFVFDRKAFWELGKFSLTIFAGNFFVMLVSRIDVIFITYFRALQEVAWYNISLPTATLLSFFASPIASMLYPTVTEMWHKKETVMLAKGVSSITKIFFIAMLPMAMLFVAYTDTIISMFFGRAYLPAALSLQILAIGMIFSGFYPVFAGVINGMGRPDVNTKIISLAAVANTGMNLAVVPVYGLNGAAAATALSFILTFVLSLTFLKKNIAITIRLADIGKIFLGGMVMMLCIGLLRRALALADPVIEAVVTFTAATGVYLCYLVYAKLVVRSDLEIAEAVGIKLPDALLSLCRKILRN